LGQHKIAASAVSGETDYIFGKREELYVNIGEEYSELSKSSFIPEITDNRSKATKIGNFSEPPAEVLSDQKPIEGQDLSYFAAPGPGEIVVKGYWFYQDKSGVDRPLRDARVEIWDADSSGDTLLDTTFTDNSGYYISDNISNSDEEGGGQDIYVKVYSTDNRSVRVTDFSTPGKLYNAVTQVQTDVSDGDVDMGSYSLDDAVNRMAWYIYDLIANEAFDYLADNVGWQNVYKLQVKWSPTNTSVGTYYQPGGAINLLAGDRWDSDVFLHEYGHFVMYKIYGNYMPPSPGCSAHYWGGHFGLGCAWTEGWANFLQAAIQNDPNYVDTEDQTLHINFEPPIPSASHAEDEGAVAASLWDIFDPVSTSESWDTIGNGINGSSNNGIWSIVNGIGPSDILEFYSDWINSSNGYNPEITAILQHHQIDPGTGSLKVSISPSAAVSAGAQWRVDGGSWRNSGYTQSGLSVGSHTLEFKALTGWSKPGNKTVTINYNQTANPSGTYTQETTAPSISITIPTSNPTYSASNSSLNIGGTASDNQAVTLVSWTNSRGGSGTCSGTTTWSKTGILLSSGQNVITVTARDAAGNTAADTLTVTFTPPDTSLPTVSITTPTSASTYSTDNSLLNIGGSASDNQAVTLVSWTNSRGGSGICSGTTTWSNSGIALSSGENIITVTAKDAVGNTATATLTVTYTPPDTAPEIVEEDSYPHDAQGMDDGTLRVPIDTSIVTRIKSDGGIDEDSVAMSIENQSAGMLIEKQSVNIRLQEVTDGDDTDYWIIHSPNTPFAFEQAVNFTVDAKNLNGVEMDTYYSSFKIESEAEHAAAVADTPPSTEYVDDPVIGQNTIAADPGTAIEGAQIIYANLEPVAPRFGPLEEIPNLDIIEGVGVPLNLQPANVFVKPVTVFIPCPGETDLGILEIYVFNPAIGWQASWETDGCIVPGSRVNHGPDDPDPTEPPTIEIQLNHFSGVQAGRPAEQILPSAGAGDEEVVVEKGASGGGGGGGGCFITAASAGAQGMTMAPLAFMQLLTVGFVGFVGIRRKLKK
ncbi:MAG: hypothetical protein WCB15_31315, partial [Desulfobacterales bacterium]